MNRSLSFLLVVLSISLAPVGVRAVEYAFTNIADTNTATQIGTLTDFEFGFNAGVAYFSDPPAISGNTVAFHAESGSTHGIFTGNGGPLTTIAIGNFAPASMLSRVFEPSISDGKVAFQGLFTDSFGGGSGVFVGDGASLATIVRSGDTLDTGERLSSFYDASIDRSRVTFGAFTPEGIFSGAGGPLTTIVRTGDVGPGGVFDGFRDPSISDDSVAFVGGYEQPASDRSGIFLKSDGQYRKLVSFRDPSPIGLLTHIGPPALDDEVVAFRGGGSEGEGIFVSDGNALTAIAKTGDPAPVGSFRYFQEVSIRESLVAFKGIYGEDTGIFIGDGGPLSTVIKVGDPLFGGVVRALGFGQLGFDKHGSGNLAFNYLLADERIGVAMATPVPEPSSLLLIGILLPIAGLMRNFRRG